LTRGHERKSREAAQSTSIRSHVRTGCAAYQMQRSRALDVNLSRRYRIVGSSAVSRHGRVRAANIMATQQSAA
jgi:hypothetical protein